MEKLSGIIERVTFYSEETGWSVLKVASFENEMKIIPVTVFQAKVYAGATVDFYGEWISHSKYGRQFKALKLVEKKPATTAALEKYLGSGLIHGVGPKTAKRIVNTFGSETLEVFENHPKKLLQVSGIAKKKLQGILKAWSEHKEIRNVMIFLQSHGVSTLYAVKIFKAYGEKSVDLVKENPYRLAKDIYGIGFLSADKIALSIGIDEEADLRIEAAILHTLQSSKDEGHCYLVSSQIYSAVKKLIQFKDEVKIDKLLIIMQESDVLKLAINKNEDKAYYSNSLFFDEKYIASALNNFLSIKDDREYEHIDTWLFNYNKNQKFPLSDEQISSVAGVCRSGFSILTGGPGCGKTTTTKALVDLLLFLKKKMTLAAPTGRAAQRMGEVIGVPAKTIHRLLVYNPNSGGFKHNEENKLETDFVIIDESSMLDVSLTASLLKAIPIGAQLLFIGDKDQLPSVGPGNILSDLMSAKNIPCFKLTQVFRQENESYIIKYAHMINRGKVPEITSPVNDPDSWKRGVDSLFVDAEEATVAQLQFIKKMRGIFKENNLDYNEIIIKENSKFSHVDLEALKACSNWTEELKTVMKKIHPWSMIHYGLTAKDSLLKLYLESIPRYIGSNNEIQILSPMTKGSMGTMNLNKEIQKHKNPFISNSTELKIADRIFRVGDRVIQKKNNYDLEVFNGDIGIINYISPVELSMEVRFTSLDNEKIVGYPKENILELDLAYAITIHKSQGSEFDVVIIPILTQHFNMLYRNLIYTALTRAKKFVVFVGMRQALTMAVKNIDNRTRQTMLTELIDDS